MRLVKHFLGAIAALCVGVVYICAFIFLRLTRWLKPRRRTVQPGRRLRVLLLGRVDSQNWCRAHLDPIARSEAVEKVLALIDGPVTVSEKVTLILVPPTFSRLFKRQLARILWAAWIAFRQKPDVIIGYSFLPNALWSALLARITGAAAFYQMTGGPLEITSAGGFAKERGPLLVTDRLKAVLARLAGWILPNFDAVIVRGGQAQAFVRKLAPDVEVNIIAGGVDESRFPSMGGDRDIDITFLGRIVGVKQPVHVVEVAARVLARRPETQVVIAGSGPLLPEVQAAAERLGVANQIKFPGHVEKIGELLSRTRIFILTSRSEGLSIALAEAMIAGAVPVVVDVGDLGELVKSGSTGWLVPVDDFDTHARRILEVLESASEWARLSANGREAALDFNGLSGVANRWTCCFSQIFPDLVLGSEHGSAAI